LSQVLTVLLVGLDEAAGAELAEDEGFSAQATEDLVEGLDRVLAPDAVVISLDGRTPLETLGRIHVRAPEAAVIVVTDPSHESDGAVALHAGAEDHLVLGTIPLGLLPRAIRYAVGQRRLHRELATTDEVTGLPNLRGFAAFGEHHLRMANRAKAPVVFLFVRLDGYADVLSSEGPAAAGDLAREAADVLLDAVRDSDLPARLADDTFCVLLTGDAAGAETLVLSRLVEAIASHEARRTDPRELSLSVGSSLYDPEHPATLEQILESAGRRLAEQTTRRPDSP